MFKEQIEKQTHRDKVKAIIQEIKKLEISFDHPDRQRVGSYLITVFGQESKTFCIEALGHSNGFNSDIYDQLYSTVTNDGKKKPELARFTDFARILAKYGVDVNAFGFDSKTYKRKTDDLNPKTPSKAQPEVTKMLTSNISEKAMSNTKETKEIDERSLGDHAKNYVRIGTKFFKNATVVNLKNEARQVLLDWSYQTMRQDYGTSKFFWDHVLKYTAFCNCPDNTTNYSRSLRAGDGRCYNLYEPVVHIPAKGKIRNTIKFIRHIFGDKIVFALDYLTILYQLPTENLPVLCLVSRENETGKSTFLQLLGRIFGNNVIILGNEDFSGKFNRHYASKLVIGVDESFIERTLIKEKIKRLSTDNKINLEAKGKDIVTIDFIGKFILCSNREDNFISMDREDRRFAVFKIPTIPKEDRDPAFLQKMQGEIPAFLHYLSVRKIRHPRRTRLWFEQKDYETDALKNVIRTTRSKIQQEMIRWFDEMFAYEHAIGETIKITPKILATAIQMNLRSTHGLPTEVEKIFKDEWNIAPSKNSKFSYPTINPEGTSDFEIGPVVEMKSWTGKYYTITKEMINTLSGDL